jgi:hypothetical protein
MANVSPPGSGVSDFSRVLTEERISTVGVNSFVVPSGVNALDVKLTGAGGGGGGGHATGGGGGGGGASPETDWISLPVTPGSTLTVTIPAGGAGGAVGANGSDGGITTLTGALVVCPASGYGERGFAGAAANGGMGGFTVGDAGLVTPGTRASGGAAAGASSAQYTNGIVAPLLYASGGGAGAGTGSGGGGGGRPFTQTTAVAGGANIGGGAGGCNRHGLGGVGGATSVAGTAAASTAYGCGGGGGGQNAIGAAGAPGFARIRYASPT